MTENNEVKRIEEKLASFKELPFLFIGSGFSRRYLNLPDWEGLLKVFAEVTNNGDSLVYSKYKNNAKSQEGNDNCLPLVASLIQADFDKNWYDQKNGIDPSKFDLIEAGVSPFKIAVSEYCEKAAKISADEALIDELAVFKRLAKRSLAGVITTNYDNLIESYLEDYEVYIGQDELIFKPIHGIHEIYKIHGCQKRPASLVITQTDYIEFSKKNAYLAAKLLTIFVEHPIIFMGYSIQDSNIRQILSAIVQCLPNDKLEKLKDRLIFVEWKDDPEKVEYGSHSINFSENKVLHMTKFIVSDFKMVFSGLSKLRAKYDLKILRKLKNDVYEIVTHNKPAEEYRMINLDESTGGEPKTVAGVSLSSDGHEYRMPSASEIYRDIILDDGGFDATRLINESLPSLLKQHSNSLPVYKYIKNYGNSALPSFLSSFNAKSIDKFLSKTSLNKKETSSLSWEKFLELLKTDRAKAFNKFPLLPENEIKVEDLKIVLFEIFQENPDILETHEKNHFKTDLRRTIKILDWLLYGKEKAA